MTVINRKADSRAASRSGIEPIDKMEVTLRPCNYVGSVISDIEMEHGRVIELLDTLSQRLEPVLRPRNTDSKEPGANTIRESSSPTVESLFRIVTRLQADQAILNDVLGRLEV